MVLSVRKKLKGEGRPGSSGSCEWCRNISKEKLRGIKKAHAW